MAHQAQQAYCESVKARFPQHFTGKRVLDIGSLDVNGTNRYLFTDCEYTGIDAAPGPNVDIIVEAAKHTVPDGHYETIISTECFEHDFHWMATFKAIRRMVASGGLFLFTCATTGRAEHGTERSKPGDCPNIPWPSYYRNVTEDDVRWVYGEHYAMEGWGEHRFEIGHETCDLYGYMVRV